MQTKSGLHIFDFDDYKALVKAWVGKQKSGGRGQLRAMAQHLGVGTTFVSQVFSGDRQLTVDQALQITGYLGFTQLERDYFLLLIQRERSATHELKEYYSLKIETLRDKSKNLKDVIDVDKELTEVEKATFYSDWYYSAIRHLSALPGVHSVNTLATRLELPHKTTEQAVNFLIETGLCILENGSVRPGPRLTHLEASSPYVKSRQLHWRMKAVEKMTFKSSDSLFYTCPMSLSAEASAIVRKELLATIQRILSTVTQSEAEVVSCLNIDWFEF